MHKNNINYDAVRNTNINTQVKKLIKLKFREFEGGDTDNE